MKTKKIKKIYSDIDKSLFRFKLQLDAWIDPVCHIINKSSESILDVGCGQGYPMRLIKLIMHPKYVVGVDLFEKYTNEARADELHEDYIITDVRKMKFPRKSFDIVLASHVIEHLPQKDGRKFIKNLERIAKKQVIVVTPIGYSYHPTVDNNILQLHVSFYYPEYFEKLGYKIIKFGSKSIIGEEGLVHKVKIDPIKKIIFFLNILFSHFYYYQQNLANCYFVAYKNIKTNK